MYGDDWSGYVVPSSVVVAWFGSWGYTAGWNNFLRSYVGEDNSYDYYSLAGRNKHHPSDSVFQCPGSKAVSIYSPPGLQSGFAINLGCWKWNGGYVNRGAKVSDNGGVDRQARWREVRAPSRNILYVDYPTNENVLNTGGGWTYIWRPDYVWNCYIEGSTSQSTAASLHPGGKLNYAMFDGHVQSMWFEETMSTNSHGYPIGMWTWGDD
jgi:prepilin-type processing-associated H-X9-DG protein